ncbi:MAG: MoaD/ThiS family protein [Rhodospirillales bacterium]|nr:MAG: MoaD/ThiS family protein [Rhodospirillales bacterium]
MDSKSRDKTGGSMIGHNAGDVTVTIEVRLFNSLCKHAGNRGAVLPLTLPAGSSVGDVLQELVIPPDAVYLVLRNGRDITPSLYRGINVEAILDEGDVIALSGPVPYSWGYGAPVV